MAAVYIVNTWSGFMSLSYYVPALHRVDDYISRSGVYGWHVQFNLTLLRMIRCVGTRPGCTGTADSDGLAAHSVHRAR